MRNIILSDIHGCFNEAIKILAQINFNPDRDCLISVGDLCDRGPECHSVYRLFKRLKEYMKDRCVIIRGNHEQMMLDAAEYSYNEGLWLQNGGDVTLRDLKDNGVELDEYAEWVKNNTVYYYVDKKDGFQCVHAEVLSENPEDNDIDTLLWGRKNIDDNYYAGRLTIGGHTPIPRAVYLDGSGERPVFLDYGVDCRKPETGMICIDTGCVFGYYLTALIIDENTIRLEKAERTEK